MIIDLPTSTITIAGVRLPACNVVCPPTEWEPDLTDWERSLGGRYGPGILNQSGDTVYIPTENGVLISVETDDAKPGVYKVMLHTRTCGLSDGNPHPIWVPRFVSINGGRLGAHTDDHRSHGPFTWDGAEPEWVIEFIGRVAAMPFTQPSGPPVRLIDLRVSDSIDVGR